jgi:hypothetical protein
MKDLVTIAIVCSGYGDYLSSEEGRRVDFWAAPFAPECAYGPVQLRNASIPANISSMMGATPVHSLKPKAP